MSPEDALANSNTSRDGTGAPSCASSSASIMSVKTSLARYRLRPRMGIVTSSKKRLYRRALPDFLQALESIESEFAVR